VKAQDERDAKLPKDGKTRIADVLDMNHEVYLNGLVSAMFMNLKKSVKPAKYII